MNVVECCAGVGMAELLFCDLWRVACVHDEGRNGVAGKHEGRTAEYRARRGLAKADILKKCSGGRHALRAKHR